MAASALDSNIQHAAVVSESGQRVITIVTDQHGNLQTTGGMTQPFFVTMQHGQQSRTFKAEINVAAGAHVLIQGLFCCSAGGTGQHGDGGGGERGASAPSLQEEEAGGDQQPQ